jgi:hypothetical protein
LREAVTENPEGLYFDVTSPLGPHGNELMTLGELSVGESLQVVGPDPYHRRNWYASVVKTSDGIKVS